VLLIGRQVLRTLPTLVIFAAIALAICARFTFG
jgi:hypothetical protein